ncbi:MAG: hypothetical protein IH984_09105 [Planctomycetes bacterium]|nr:hypothetical protein [Planctomycetota bacterium]
MFIARKIVLVIFGILLLSGCQGRLSSSRGIFNFEELFTGQRSIDEPIVLQVLGPIEINVESFGGDVIINVDEELTAAKVTITRVAVHGAGRKEEAEASLSQIDYTVEIVPGDLGQVLRVRTFTTHAEPHFQRADILIELPAVDGVYVITERGDVVAKNIEGVVKISNNLGDVRVMTNLPMKRSVEIINSEGDIEYRVRGESTGVFDCKAEGGRVEHVVKYGLFRIAPNRRRGILQAALNNGDNLIKLVTQDGNIFIAVVADPTDVGILLFP